MALAVALVLLVVGSVLFHFLSPWWFTPIASNWGTIDDTVILTFWVTGAVFIAVNLFMAYCVIRYRHKKGQRAHYEPENKKLEWWLTGLTTLGVVAMLAPGLFVWAKFINVPEDASVFEAVGQQWNWSYRFPGKDGVLGTVDPANITIDNPFGMNPDDPNGQDDILVSSPEVHLPLNKPVKVLLRATDVLHNFAVAQFRVKMDMVPGLVTYFWFTPTRTGTFEVLCEELCGLGHHTMRGNVVIDEEEDFQAWLNSNPTYAETQAQTGGDAEAGAALYAVCLACHGTEGEGNIALNSPKISGQDDWYLIRQLKYFKGGIRGSDEDDAFGRQMAPMAAILPDDAAIKNVVAYIETLADNPASATIDGDTARGRDIFSTCGACHGLDGQGIWSLKAPRLAGMTDWYMVTQLKNFKHGIRGTHAGDMYGGQMGAMARILTDDQAINDVIAYINTLDETVARN